MSQPDKCPSDRSRYMIRHPLDTVTRRYYCAAYLPIRDLATASGHDSLASTKQHPFSGRLDSSPCFREGGEEKKKRPAGGLFPLMGALFDAHGGVSQSILRTAISAPPSNRFAGPIRSCIHNNLEKGKTKIKQEEERRANWRACAIPGGAAAYRDWSRMLGCAMTAPHKEEAQAL